MIDSYFIFCKLYPSPFVATDMDSDGIVIPNWSEASTAHAPLCLVSTSSTVSSSSNVSVYRSSTKRESFL